MKIYNVLLPITQNIMFPILYISIRHFTYTNISLKSILI